MAEAADATAPAASPAPTGRDPLSLLEAAGIGDGEDAGYEDLDGLGEEAPEGEADGEPVEGSADKPLEDTPESEEDEPAPEDITGLKGKGTREMPLKHRELPADKFVELKTADGSRVVVSLKDALSGTFMSRDMVNRHVSVAKEAEQRAQAIATRAVEHQQQANAGMRQMLQSPEALVKALVENGMPVLHQVARAYALMRQDPSLRQGLLAQLREENISAQHRDVEQRQRALQQREQDTAQEAQLKRDLGPAYRQGLKESGILRNEDVTDELRDGIRMRFNYVIAKTGRAPTPEEMRACVVGAAQELKAKGALKPPPRPRAAPVPPPETAAKPRPNGKRDWSKVPESIRMADPDFLFDRAARELVRRGS